MRKEQALDKLMGICSRRECCTGQVRQMMIRWNLRDQRGEHLSVEDIDWVVETLVRQKFVDDLRFVRAYTADKAKLSGWGKTKIIFSLRCLGLTTPEVIAEVEQAISSVDVRGRLAELLLRKWKSMESKEESLAVKRTKIVRFAVGRGYDYGMVKDLLERELNLFF